jgi:hypothetical protein
LDRYEFSKVLGEGSFFDTFEDVVEAYQCRHTD